MYKYTFCAFRCRARGDTPFHSLSVRSPRGQRCRKWPFSDHPKTTFRVLAMVVRIVKTIASKKMTIAATPKTDLRRAGNSGETVADYPCFVKYCYFYDPCGAPKRPRRPQKQPWVVEKIRNLCPTERPLRLYIYAETPRVLHKYAVACKGFSQFSAMAVTAIETMIVMWTA